MENLEDRVVKIEEMVKENNAILRKMRRGQIWASIMRALYWIIILGIAGATYYFLQPYIEGFFDLYKSINEQIDTFGAIFKQ